MQIKFITSIYGPKLLPFLLAHIYSVINTNPNSEIVVTWSDLPKREIDFLKLAFPSVKFVESDIIIKGNLRKRIPLRLLLWMEGCRMYPGANICFLDCDTLLLKEISHFFDDEFDVLFTWKEEGLLNAGVLLIKNNMSAQSFMEKWVKETEAVVSDPKKLVEACNTSGGGSQHTLRLILNTTCYENRIERRIDGSRVIFKGVPGRILNETSPTASITEETHVIHYKGEPAHLILLFEFARSALQKESMGEVHSYFDQILEKAKRWASEKIVFDSCSNYMEKFRCMVEREGGRFPYREALALYSISQAVGVEALMEVGESEFGFLAKYFDKKIKCVSVGDSALIAEIGEKLGKTKIGVLIKGEDEEVIHSFNTLLAVSKNVSVGFFLYPQRNVEMRKLIKERFSQVFFTDDEKYIKKFGLLNSQDNSLTIVFPSFKETPLREIVALLPGTSYLVKGDYGEAIEEFDRAIFLYPKVAIIKLSATLQKAVAYARVKEYKKAVAMYEEVLPLVTGDKELEIIVHHNLGLIYRKMGLRKKAKDECEIVSNLSQRINPLERRKIMKNSYLLSLFQKL